MTGQTCTAGVHARWAARCGRNAGSCRSACSTCPPVLLAPPVPGAPPVPPASSFRASAGVASGLASEPATPPLPPWPVAPPVAPELPPVAEPVDPPVIAPAFPPFDVPVVPPFDVPVFPPFDVPVFPPFDVPVLPPFDVPVFPPLDVPVAPPPDAPVVPPLEVALVEPPVLAGLVTELPLLQPRSAIATISVSFFMCPSSGPPSAGSQLENRGIPFLELYLQPIQLPPTPRVTANRMNYVAIRTPTHNPVRDAARPVSDLPQAPPEQFTCNCRQVRTKSVRQGTGKKGSTPCLATHGAQIP
jgi:hypothetical protein